MEHSDVRIAQIRKLHRRDNAGQRKLGMKFCKMAGTWSGFSYPQNDLHGVGICWEDLSDSSNLSRGKWTINWI